MEDIGKKLLQEVKANHISAVKKILNGNPSIINYIIDDDLTALMWASKWGRTEIVRLLLQAGANPDLQTIDDWTALMEASREGNIECVQLLLDFGANPDLQDKRGWTALYYGGYTECIRLLLDFGANVNIQSNNGYTALMRASAWGRKDYVSLLLQWGANPLLKNSDGKTAYDLTMNKTIKKLLLKAMNTWLLMPLYVQSYRDTKNKIPLDLVRKVSEMFSLE